jgi:hypothetical protein
VGCTRLQESDLVLRSDKEVAMESLSKCLIRDVVYVGRRDNERERLFVPLLFRPGVPISLRHDLKQGQQVIILALLCGGHKISRSRQSPRLIFPSSGGAGVSARACKVKRLVTSGDLYEFQRRRTVS